MAFRNLFNGLDFPFSSHKVKINSLNDNPAIKENLLSEEKSSNKRAEALRHLETGKAQAVSDPVLAIGELSISNAVLEGFNQVQSLNYSALAYSRVYEYFLDKKTVNLPSILSEIKEINEVKEIAFAMLKQAEDISDDLKKTLSKTLPQDEKSLEILNATYYMLRAANYYVKAELYLKSNQLEEATACYAELQSSLQNAKADDFNNYYLRARIRYVSMLAQQSNPKVRVADIFEDIEKKYFPENDKEKNNQDAGSFFEEYGDWLFKLGHYPAAIEKYKLAHESYSRFSYEPYDPYNRKTESMLVKIGSTQKEFDRLKSVPIKLKVPHQFKVESEEKDKSFFSRFTWFNSKLISNNNVNNTNNNTNANSKVNSTLVSSDKKSYGATNN